MAEVDCSGAEAMVLCFFGLERQCMMGVVVLEMKVQDVLGECDD